MQKKLPFTAEEHRELKARGLVEGRFPSIMVSAKLAKATGETGRHIRERGFDKQYYLDLLLALIKEHGPVGRGEVDQLLLSKLPERLTDEQKKNQVRNLLQELRSQKCIENVGTRGAPQWVSVETVGDGNDQ